MRLLSGAHAHATTHAGTYAHLGLGAGAARGLGFAGERSGNVTM